MTTGRHSHHSSVRPAALLAAAVAALLLGLVSQASAVELPDSRVYEMVTPVENYDADAYVPRGIPPIFVGNAGEVSTSLPFRVAANGEGLAYVGAPTVGGTGDNGYGGGNEYLEHRVSGGWGWSPTVNLQPGGVHSAFYQAFSPDLTVGVVQAGNAEEPGVLPLSAQAPGAGYAILYIHGLSGNEYQPFFTTKPPNRISSTFRTYNVPEIFPPAPNELAFAGASEDFNRLFFEANDALTANAVDGGEEENNLYESVDGRLSLVNVLPDGSTESNATFGATSFGRPILNPPDFSGVISGDGSRVFWSDLNPGREALYVSENVGSSGERTVQVDASQVQGGKGGGSRFWTANKDGSRVFFTDSDLADLTGDTQPGSGQNLYVYEVPTGRLTDLTSAADAGVQGVIGQGESDAGEYTVYFIATGVLSENQNSDGVEATAGDDNLYVLHEGGQPTFVAALSAADGSQAIEPLSFSGLEEFGDWQPSSGHRTAEVTPDGRSVVFMSNNQSGTGNFVEVGGRRLEEVYVYDGGSGGLFCASCSRDGVEPQLNAESGSGLGAYLPLSSSSTYLPQWISNDGSRVFFDSDEPLVPGDTNGEQDVYEWERDGAGGCVAVSGCVYLLSGGVGHASSWLIGGSETGGDVFFVSRTEFVPGLGRDEAYNIYDARVGGIPAVSSPVCTGTGCQGVPAAPPTFATPASVTFSGVGNFMTPAGKPLKQEKKVAKPKRKSRRKPKRKVRRGKSKARGLGVKTETGLGGGGR